MKNARNHEAIVVDARARRVKPSCLFVVAFGAILVILVALLLIIYQDTSLLYNDKRILEQQPPQQLHKNLVPFSTRDAVGFSLATLGLLLAAGGGIGGGGILVPIYILILQFPPKNAIPLSNVTVFGGAVANTLLNIRKRHALADRPLIDWELILVMEPLTILGSLVGANLNKLLPETVIVVLLVILLSLTAYKTLFKAVLLYEMETYSQIHQGNDGEDDKENDVELAEMTSLPTTVSLPKPSRLTRRASDSGTVIKNGKMLLLHQPISVRRTSSFPQSVLQGKSIDHDLSSSSPETLVAVSEHRQHFRSESSLELNVQACTNSMETIQHFPRNPALVQILQEERYTPTTYVCWIVSLFLFVLLVNILKGGGAFESPLGIVCGSVWFWIAQGIIAVVICIVSIKARSSLLQRTRFKHNAGYQYLATDIEWNETSTFYYPLLSCTAGFVAGLFGIGGGIIKGPLMLALGVHPSVASATSACMILFTSFTATTSFVVFGLMIKDYGIFCLITGFIATLLGQTIMSYILERRQRSSYIAFCIGGVVLLSALCMTVESIISILNGASDGGRTSGLCSAHLE